MNARRNALSAPPNTHATAVTAKYRAGGAAKTGAMEDAPCAAAATAEAAAGAPRVNAAAAAASGSGRDPEVFRRRLGGGVGGDGDDRESGRRGNLRRKGKRGDTADGVAGARREARRRGAGKGHLRVALGVSLDARLDV